MSTPTLTSRLWGLAKQSAQEIGVPSFTEDNKTYVVTDAFTPFAHCTCPDNQYRGRERPCKHIMFARQAIEQMTALRLDLRDQLNDPQEGVRLREAATG